MKTEEKLQEQAMSLHKDSTITAIQRHIQTPGTARGARVYATDKSMHHICWTSPQMRKANAIKSITFPNMAKLVANVEIIELIPRSMMVTSTSSGGASLASPRLRVRRME